MTPAANRSYANRTANAKSVANPKRHSSCFTFRRRTAFSHLAPRRFRARPNRAGRATRTRGICNFSGDETGVAAMFYYYFRQHIPTGTCGYKRLGFPLFSSGGGKLRFCLRQRCGFSATRAVRASRDFYTVCPSRQRRLSRRPRYDPARFFTEIRNVYEKYVEKT